MTEQEYDEALLDEIKLRIAANIDEMKRYDDDPSQRQFYLGANTALEDLAVQFGLVDNFGLLVKD